jgi:hypothetical protein
MTELIFNDGDTDYKISKIRIIDRGFGVLQVDIYPERNSTKTYWLQEVERR